MDSPFRHTFGDSSFSLQSSLSASLPFSSSRTTATKNGMLQDQNQYPEYMSSAPKNPMLYKTELCESIMKDEQCKYVLRFISSNFQHFKQTLLIQVWHKLLVCSWTSRVAIETFSGAIGKTQVPTDERVEQKRWQLSAAPLLPVLPPRSTYQQLLIQLSKSISKFQE